MWGDKTSKKHRMRRKGGGHQYCLLRGTEERGAAKKVGSSTDMNVRTLSLTKGLSYRLKKEWLRNRSCNKGQTTPRTRITSRISESQGRKRGAKSRKKGGFEKPHELKRSEAEISYNEGRKQSSRVEVKDKNERGLVKI